MLTNVAFLLHQQSFSTCQLCTFEMSLEASGASKELGPSSGKPGFPGVLLPEHLSFPLKAPAELIMSKKAAEPGAERPN